MPVYQNNTSETIIAYFRDAFGKDVSIPIASGKSYTTECIINTAGLTKISDAPYYNPITLTSLVTSTGSSDDKTVSIPLTTKNISIWNSDISVLVTVYLNSKNNTPGIPVYPESERIIDLNHNVNQIILSFSAAASVRVEGRK